MSTWNVTARVRSCAGWPDWHSDGPCYYGNLWHCGWLLHDKLGILGKGNEYEQVSPPHTTHPFHFLVCFRLMQPITEQSMGEIWSRLIGEKSKWIADFSLMALCFGCCVFYSAFIGVALYLFIIFVHQSFLQNASPHTLTYPLAIPTRRHFSRCRIGSRSYRCFFETVGSSR